MYQGKYRSHYSRSDGSTLFVALMLLITCGLGLGTVWSLEWLKEVSSMQRKAQRTAFLLSKTVACNMPHLKGTVAQLNEHIRKEQQTEQEWKWLYIPGYFVESWSSFKTLSLPECLRNPFNVPKGPFT